MDAVLPGTCVLLKSYLCDTLLPAAEEGAFRRVTGARAPDRVHGQPPEGPARPAAAVAGRADVLVTENLKDFPLASAAPLGITVAGQDDFLLGLLDLHPDAVPGALRRQASRYRREPRTAAALLAILAGPGHGCPEFARQCRALL